MGSLTRRGVLLNDACLPFCLGIPDAAINFFWLGLLEISLKTAFSRLEVPGAQGLKQ